MKKYLKKVGLILLIVFILFSLFVVEESIRLERNLNARPLIILGVDTNIQIGKVQVVDEYTSLGFVLKDTYLRDPKSSEDNVAYYLIGRGFYLFGKFRLWEWIS